MNAGIVSSRYAHALLKYVNETGNGRQVYEQVRLLDKCLSSFPEMRKLVYLPKFTPDSVKMEVFITALGGEEKAAPELVRFIRLVLRRKRTAFLHLMLHIFMDMYRKAHNISLGRLTVPMKSDELQRILTDIVHDETGGDLELETKVDPSIIGGFVFDVEGIRLDASVASQLKTIRHQFIEKNRRIV